MPIYKGNKKIETIYHGSTKIGYVFKGSTLVYNSKGTGNTIFESDVGGTYTVKLPANNGLYEVICVGAGGMSTIQCYGENNGSMATGGSGAAFVGRFRLNAGNYTVHVGEVKDIRYNKYTLADYNNLVNANSSISNVLTAGGGSAGTVYSKVGYVNENNRTSVAGTGGKITLIATPIATTMNKAGNNGSTYVGPKGGNDSSTGTASGVIYVNRVASVYQPSLTRTENLKSVSGWDRTFSNTNYGYGAGGAGSTSEYVGRSSILLPMGGYVKISYIGD